MTQLTVVHSSNSEAHSLDQHVQAYRPPLLPQAELTVSPSVLSETLLVCRPYRRRGHRTPWVEALQVWTDMQKKQKIPHTMDTTHVQKGTAKHKNPKPNSNYTQKYDPARTYYGLTEHNAVLSGTYTSLSETVTLSSQTKSLNTVLID